MVSSQCVCHVVLAGVLDYFDTREMRQLRQAFYATNTTVVVEACSLTCFDALIVTSSGCTPSVCSSSLMLHLRLPSFHRQPIAHPS